MLSLYGSKGRIVQAHMPSESGRLQVRYSSFFDFRELTEDSLNICVRWFLNEPLAAAPMSRSELDCSELRNNPEDLGEAEVNNPPASESGVSDSPQRNATDHRDVPRTPSKTVSTPLLNSPCNTEESSFDQTGSPRRILLRT